MKTASVNETRVPMERSGPNGAELTDAIIVMIGPPRSGSADGTCTAKYGGTMNVIFSAPVVNSCDRGVQTALRHGLFKDVTDRVLFWGSI